MAVPPVSNGPISHSPRSQHDRTRQEDRHFKFYARWDNLTDLSDLALILGEYGDQLDRAHVRRLALTKFELVKQGDRRTRIEANVEALRATYEQTVSGLAPDALPFADAQTLTLAALSSLMP